VACQWEPIITEEEMITWSQRYKSDPVSGEKVIHPGHQSW